LTYKLAQDAGVAAPHSYVPGNADSLATLDLDFPVVLKPAISSGFAATTKRKAYRANTREELQSLYGTMSRVMGPSQVIVQDFLPDPARNLFSFAGYFKEGEPILGLAVKRTRQFPRDFGLFSTFAEAVELPELRELASQLLRVIRYSGLAEVEFMWNAKRGRFELLDVNARLWAWHSLAIAAGLDLPYVAFADAIGQSPTLGTKRQGAKWVRFSTDLRAATQEIRSGTLSLKQYLNSLRRATAFSVFSPSDPMPFIAEVFLLLLNRVKRLASRGGATLYRWFVFRGRSRLVSSGQRARSVKAKQADTDGAYLAGGGRARC